MRSALNIKYIAISGTNVGGGVGLFKRVSPSNNMNFKTLVPAGGISITSDNNTITISGGSGGGGTGTTNASNGLTKVGNNITLGGTLTGDTTVQGINTGLIFYMVDGINDNNGVAIITPTQNIIASNSNVLNTNISISTNSDGTFAIQNTINSKTISNYMVEGVWGVGVLGVNNHNFSISDLEGITFDAPSGITYVSDYSANYTPRTLVDKGYVDGIVEGVVEQVTIDGTVISNTSGYALVDSSVSAMTVYLPSGLTTNKKLTIKDKTGNGNTNNIIIDGNGHNIDGSSTATIGTNYGGIQFLYSIDDTAWFIIGYV